MSKKLALFETADTVATGLAVQSGFATQMSELPIGEFWNHHLQHNTLKSSVSDHSLPSNTAPVTSSGSKLTDKQHRHSCSRDGQTAALGNLVSWPDPLRPHPSTEPQRETSIAK